LKFAFFAYFKFEFKINDCAKNSEILDLSLWECTFKKNIKKFGNRSINQRRNQRFLNFETYFTRIPHPVKDSEPPKAKKLKIGVARKPDQLHGKKNSCPQSMKNLAGSKSCSECRTVFSV
jgi:hypothetical protein